MRPSHEQETSRVPSRLKPTPETGSECAGRVRSVLPAEVGRSSAGRHTARDYAGWEGEGRENRDTLELDRRVPLPRPSSLASERRCAVERPSSDSTRLSSALADPLSHPLRSRSFSLSPPSSLYRPALTHQLLRPITKHTRPCRHSPASSPVG